jgi:opacity protein-like surface antigen
MRKAILTAMVVGLAAAAAQAQDPRVEISGTAAWTYSDGVTASPVTLPGVGTFDSIEPKDSFSWGVRLGFMATPNVEIGALYDQQQSKLQIGGTNPFEIGDMSVHNYHGYLAYNFGEASAKVRPYVLGGLGATQYGAVTAKVGSVERDIDGTTKFSTTWGAGLKMYPGKNFGIRIEGRWTPTYIKSDAAGWWCDPYWGCYVASDAQYSNQFELGGGITLRF